MAEHPTFAQSEQLEAWLASHGVTHAHKSLSTAGIDKQKSLTNQSRFAPLEPEVVKTYASAMKEGDKFPPIVVYQDERGAYVVIDGNHRVAAAEAAGFTDIDAYVVTGAASNIIQVMTFEANTKHGLPASVEERVAHGIYLVSELNVTQRDAARLVNVDLTSFRTAWDHHEAERRLARQGIERWQELGKTNRRRLANIRSDVVLRAAMRLAIEAHLGTVEVENLVTRINRETDETPQLEIVAKVREEQASIIKSTAGGRLPNAQNMRLYRGLGLIEGIVLEEIPGFVGAMSDEQLASTAARVRRGILMLMEVQRGLENGRAV